VQEEGTTGKGNAELAEWQKSFAVKNAGGYNFAVHVHLHKEGEHKTRVKEGRVKRNAREYAKQKDVLERKLKAENTEAGQKVRTNVHHAKKQSVEDAEDKSNVQYESDDKHKEVISAL
jgi:hypothetical protein